MMSTTLLTPATLAQTIPQHHAQQASVLDVFVSSSTASTASTATSGYGGESTSSSKSSSQSRLEEVGNGSGGAFGPPYNNSQQASPATTPHALSTLGDEEDLAAQTRDRSNTWPLRRPNLDINAQTSPLIHEQIPEEDNDMFGSEEHLTPGLTEPMMAGTPEGPHHDFDIASPLVGTQPPPSATPDTADGAGNASKKSTTRRNAWGNMSYADLITQAIMSSPEKKLTLSQVYEWMVQNVPYFRDKGDSNSSAGWKNSIRHNLSLHNRFMRIQNEGAGKSSWWVINPDAKPGRNPRRPRAATMDNTTKVSMEKKRRGAKKRVDMPGNIRGPGLSANSLVGSQASILSHGDVYDDEPMSSFDTFRPRTQSTISIPATTSRVSPSMDSGTFDEFDFPPWVDQAQQAQAQQAVQAAAAAAAAPHCVNELLDRTCQIRIGDNGVPDASSFSRMLNGSHLNGIKTSPTQIKQETLSNGGIKNEINGVHPPPSYHELNSVRANSQLQQNPLLRNQLQSHLLGAKLSAPPPVVGFPCFSTPMYTAIAAGCPSTMLQWPGPSTTATLVSQPISCGQSAGLPTDLENLNLPDHSLMDLDMESLLRHELELSQNEKLGFD